MWKCAACISRALYRLAERRPLFPVHPYPLNPCDLLSCSAASGSEKRGKGGGNYSPVRAPALSSAWLESPGAHGASSSALCNTVFWAMPSTQGCGRVSANENSHQKSKAGRVRHFFFPPMATTSSPSPPQCGPLRADQFFTHSSPIRRAYDVMRTLCILTRGAQWM